MRVVVFIVHCDHSLDRRKVDFSANVAQGAASLVGSILVPKTLFPIGPDRGAVAVFLGVYRFFSFGEIIA